MQPAEHEAHHQSLEERVSELERIVKAATTPPSVPPAQPESAAQQGIASATRVGGAKRVIEFDGNVERHST